MSASVEGLDDVLRNLNREIDGIENRTMAGLMAGGLIVQGESQKHTPVEYGNLRASAYTRKVPEDALTVEVGYTSEYAVYVHENLEAKWAGKPRPSGLGVYWGPKGTPKFLENAVRDKAKSVLNAIRKYAKVSE